jgi:hypothetical protein
LFCHFPKFGLFRSIPIQMPKIFGFSAARTAVNDASNRTIPASAAGTAVRRAPWP